jgi:guanosine-3',5'-bis(diphosphate) 3'-pyrophosphohydrolase
VVETELNILVQKVKSYNPEADIDLIRKAFDLARQSHQTQKRKSGEDFIHHPLGVAEILADLRMDSNTLVAALLHDIVEDTDITIDQIREEFGDEIAEIVNGVTKLGRISFNTKAEAQAESLRKMLIAMAKDIRVILIKLADRLHNMRTICYMSQDTQREKAEETLEIYAPLAHRLGIFQLKWDLEDLAFFTLEPKKYNQLQKMLTESREQREQFLEGVIQDIKGELQKLNINCQIYGRTKHLYSIYQKMVKRDKEFSEIYDLSAVRVIVDSVSDCYAALGAVHSRWRPLPGRFKDFIAMPKFNLYQSLHTTIIGPAGRPFEVQIRTMEMHRTAEYGIAAHWLYKEGGKAGTDQQQFAWLRQMLEWQTETEDPREFMESLKVDLFEDEVFVFTPKGDVVTLRAHSTPLDFAYSIHTEVGHHCVGAKVNNQIVPLGYQLQIGDIVDIMTSKSSTGPSRDWLSIAKSSRARSKIRQWFSKERREDSEEQGRELLQKSLRKQGAKLTHLDSVKALEQVAKEMNFSRPDTMIASIGAGKISAKQVAAKVIKILNHEEEEPKELVLPTAPPRHYEQKIGRTGIKVKGIDDVMVRLAHCCHPVPGDAIIGFITRGRGLSVHRADCSNARALKATPERLLDVFWDADQQSTYQVEIQVEAMDRTKLLSDISTVLADAGVNILSASVSTRKDRLAVFRFIFEIGNLDNLKNILRTVKQIEAVFDVYRVLPHQSHTTAR